MRVKKKPRFKNVENAEKRIQLLERRMFDAICDPVARLRVELKTSDLSRDEIDRKLRDVVSEIWTKVKIEAGIRD